MVEGMEGGGETDSITAASAAYLNQPLEQTAHPASSFRPVSVSSRVGRCSPLALGVRGKTVQNLLTQIPHAVWGALAGAILALAGVVITNWSNNKRLKIQLRHDAAERNKEREVAMRRQVYLDAAKEVVKAPQYLATLPSKDLSRVETQTELSELFARVNQVHLVGQKETVEAVSVWSIGLTKSVFGLMQHVMPMPITRNEIERLNQEVEENSTKSAEYLAQLVQRHLAGNLDESTWSVINQHIEFHYV
jgi:hypothetical protein